MPLSAPPPKRESPPCAALPSPCWPCCRSPPPRPPPRARPPPGSGRRGALPPARRSCDGRRAAVGHGCGGKHCTGGSRLPPHFPRPPARHPHHRRARRPRTARSVALQFAQALARVCTCGRHEHVPSTPTPSLRTRLARTHSLTSTPAHAADVAVAEGRGGRGAKRDTHAYLQVAVQQVPRVHVVQPQRHARDVEARVPARARGRSGSYAHCLFPPKPTSSRGVAASRAEPAGGAEQGGAWCRAGQGAHGSLSGWRCACR